MSEEDPLIRVRKDTFNHEIYLQLFGEVQKEVIEAILLEREGIAVKFSETSILCIEKPKKIGHAFERMGDDGNPFYATIGFCVAPGPSGSGITYHLDVELGSLPLSFHKAIEDSVYEVLKQGLYGWEVSDSVITLTMSGYGSAVSTASDFRNLAPLVLMKALKQAGTDVYEPVNRFELSVPIPSLSNAMFKLSNAGAEMDDPVIMNNTVLITGKIPVAATETVKAEVIAFSKGEGVFIARPSDYRKMTQDFPIRKRQDYNPLNRKEYLMHIMRTIRG